ncbi:MULTISPECIES: hypothetical protein, partial [unclassified Microcoleus]|uniref:hypothetical protein n=1 Tax=unclassified Microcoleus TaxID=2642155 RepID=UPI0025F4564A
MVSLILILRLFPLLNCTSKKLQSQAVNSKKKGDFFHFNKIKIFECWVIVNKGLAIKYNPSYPRRVGTKKSDISGCDFCKWDA